MWHAWFICQKDGWNDDDCTKSLPFVCEKKGDNYIDPPKPEPPKPTCGDGWKKVLDKCVYYSYDFDEKAHNWTEAQLKCRALPQGANLATIKSKAENDAFYSKHC